MPQEAMELPKPPMPEDCHVNFTEWAKQQGVQVNAKIKPTVFPGRGVGIAALDKIQVLLSLLLSLLHIASYTKAPTRLENNWYSSHALRS